MSPIKSIKDLTETIRVKLEGFDRRRECRRDNGTEYLFVYMRTYYKNGKTYKKSTDLLPIIYEPYLLERFNDSTEEVNMENWKARPYYNISEIFFGKFSNAMTKYIKLLEAFMNYDTIENSLTLIFVKCGI